jgi:mono/diheme cytochrome c family protein
MSSPANAVRTSIKQGEVNVMKLNNGAVCVALLGALACAGTAFAADRIDFGKREYLGKCASCHGQNGKGDGAVGEWLRVPPTDLTGLSKRNGGVFPYDYVYYVIDGREIVKGHGTRNMPIWGSNYAAEGIGATEYYPEMQNDMEVHVRNRIMSLIDYLNRIQVK